MGEFVKVAGTSEIAAGQARLVNIKGKLAEGDIEGHEVTCPWHGARFDIRTGEVLCAPAWRCHAVQRARHGS
ncbi:MAG: Rieske (2Fe-2S) protein [Burkholderiales bacterium]